MRPDPVRPDPRLHPGPHPPFKPARDSGKRRHKNRKHHESDEHHRDRVNNLFRYSREITLLDKLINIRLHRLLELLLPVDFRRVYIQTANESDQIGDHDALTEFIDDAHRRE